MGKSHRLIKVMELLRRNAGPVTAQALAGELGISSRSVHRDIATLREMGAVIDGEAGFGFTLIEDNALPPMMFTDTELEALVLGLREVEQIGDPEIADAASAALRKLQSRLPNRQANHLRHAALSAFRFQRPTPPSIAVPDLRKAIREEMEVAFDYRDAAGQETTRSVKPLGLVYLDRNTVLISWCNLRQETRVFRLDRMRNLACSTQSFRPQRVAMLRDAMATLKASYRNQNAEVDPAEH